MTTSGKGERKGKDAHKECRDEYARVLGEPCQTVHSRVGNTSGLMPTVRLAESIKV